MKLIYLIPLFLLFSCGGEENQDAFLPNANGQHGDILLLLDDGLWEGQVGEAITENLSRRAEGPYLRPEPMFNYFRSHPDDLSHLNKLNRNILKFMVDKDSTYKETAVFERVNYYAKGQLFLIVKDSDPNRLLDFAKNGMDEIIDRFNDFELAQLIQLYKNESNKGVNELTEKNYGISISVPEKSEIKSDKDGFLFIKHDRSKNVIGNQANKTEGGTFWIQQGFLFWKTPVYPDSAQMTVENALKNRDSTLKYNLPGPQGTYMGTEYTESYDPVGSVFDYNGHKTVEIRGLWIYEGDTFVGGGGPFVQYSILNESKNEIVTVCGYAYGPGFEKREYIREIDAVLNTIVIN